MTNKQHGGAGQITRRTFLQRSAMTAMNAAAIGMASVPLEDAGAGEANPQTSAAVVGVTLRVNGVERTLEVEPRTTLAEALRGPLGLTGTKIACNRGACSACTVWLDGTTVCSCMLLAIEADGRSVTTIEGLARGDTLHPVQEAFIAHDALQCGFCTPGMVMSCAELLGRKQTPSALEIRSAISGHFCRCGTYPHVVAAMLSLAKGGK